MAPPVGASGHIPHRGAVVGFEPSLSCGYPHLNDPHRRRLVEVVFLVANPCSSRHELNNVERKRFKMTKAQMFATLTPSHCVQRKPEWTLSRVFLPCPLSLDVSGRHQQRRCKFRRSNEGVRQIRAPSNSSKLVKRTIEKKSKQK